MGFHVCEYDRPGETYRFPTTSSGDVTLEFAGGGSWMMPDMILHYVADHKWMPPARLVVDVMDGQYIGGQRMQTMSAPTPVGYLSGEFRTGSVPDGFVEQLELLMKQADRDGKRRQTRGVILKPLVELSPEGKARMVFTKPKFSSAFFCACGDFECEKRGFDISAC